jgi:hypothetical protein
MTREEQINLYLKERNIPITSLEANSIIEGIKWADEHPNLYNDEKYHTVKVSCLDELNRKAKLYDEFLEKVCDWLDDNWYNYCCYTTFNGDLMIEDLKREMEE